MGIVSRTVVAIAVALEIAACGAAYAQAAPEAHTRSGVLAGMVDGEVASFKAIPYAAPPVGPLRWRPPQPVAPWAGVRPADRVGPICEQRYNPKDNGVGPLPMSEDCLTLNVWGPVRRPARPRPVMVWIHGGGFVNGSGTAALYDGTALARQGVVVVTLNYRLGRFGFFAHPALDAEHPAEPKGNYGLMDVVAALRWVQANIAAFGGDPRQVTIFGESAGGMAVNDLMVSPAARGLFVRAIAESGAGREPMPALPAAETAGRAFAAQVGLPQADAAALRALTPEQILKAGDPDIFTGGGAILDGKLLTIGAHEGFARGLEAKVPYLVGSNSLEFPVPASQLPALLARFPGGADAQARVAAAYPSPQAYTIHIVSDRVFTEPARELARLHAHNGQTAWLYRFSIVSPAVAKVLAGAPHASERQYVFDTLAASPWPTDANDAAQARVMSAYWTSFARTGDPNGPGRPAWPAYAAKTDRLLDFTNSGPVARPTPDAPALDAITASYPGAR